MLPRMLSSHWVVPFDAEPLALGAFNGANVSNGAQGIVKG